MRYLVDANVLSEVTRPQPAAVVVEWLRQHEKELVVTPIILGEIEYGIGLTPSARKRTVLRRWFEDGVRRLRVVDLDARTASTWAALLVRLRQKGQAMPVKDSLIAASALQHRLTIVTRNLGDFRNVGVSLVNPFER
ncbi:MAG TPA: type II toxin-antitoxin system VapC family toxin [Planctomycetaceae bacterium]|nr:type II toxin-antitoxin system VapC family toxin [Planctomycetaceae bacterium]HQZ68105.1 type II toxin-antitoxin system VapC family toxin [Planctomycetaceae bacterium]